MKQSTSVFKQECLVAQRRLGAKHWTIQSKFNYKARVLYQWQEPLLMDTLTNGTERNFSSGGLQRPHRQQLRSSSTEKLRCKGVRTHREVVGARKYF